jgi:hypothetical protein
MYSRIPCPNSFAGPSTSSNCGVMSSTSTDEALGEARAGPTESDVTMPNADVANKHDGPGILVARILKPSIFYHIHEHRMPAVCFPWSHATPQC